jgi:hypothetical protein
VRVAPPPATKQTYELGEVDLAADIDLYLGGSVPFMRPASPRTATAAKESAPVGGPSGRQSTYAMDSGGDT